MSEADAPTLLPYMAAPQEPGRGSAGRCIEFLRKGHGMDELCNLLAISSSSAFKCTKLKDLCSMYKPPYAAEHSSLFS